MTRILDFNGREADRTVTVGAIRALKGSGRQFVQVTAGTADEAAAAEEAGIDMVVCLAGAVPAVRQGSSRLFVTAAIDFGGEVTLDDLLATAFRSLSAGADAVITARRLDAVRLLADEGVPVMGHLGFVPKRATQYGGVRAIGRTATEATALYRQFQELEQAGAFAVECEVIPAQVLEQITPRTSMATISLGSGPHADVMFLFQNDIVGESPRVPRHARTYGDVAGLQRQIAAERVKALSAFRADVLSGGFPGDAEVSRIDPAELAGFIESLGTPLIPLLPRGVPRANVTRMTEPDWAPTACILCECNCGIEVRLGGGGRTFERIRGDKAHPASKGYTCEKALRLDHYQNGGERLTTPLRRRPDGTYEPVDWDTAVREVAEGFARVRDTYGGESIFFYGGGGQGNHLLGAYAAATFRAFGGRYRSSALAQEKTGEFWINGEMFGSGVRGDFEHCEVALFVGKNPWQSHGMPHARNTLKEIARDPARAIIVIDPRRTETAELADFHLAVKPGTDAWCLAALAATIVQEGLVATDWVRDHVAGAEAVTTALRAIDVDGFARISGVDPALLRGAARRIAAADSVSVFEDLGVQMGLNSTLSSWLEKLVWVLTGNFGKPGAQNIPTTLVPLVGTGKVFAGKTSPVAGARIISGLVPCNVVSEEILTDHPKRYRAMLVDSGNPAHSLADSTRMREALRALDFLVVVDVAMTETAREAHYVLPAASQYEKWECTYFNFEFPHNVFHLRRPLLDPLPGTLPEPEIHARIVEAAGLLDAEAIARLRTAADESRLAFGAAFLEYMAAHPELAGVAPIILYRTLGPTLPDGAAAAAVLWNAAHRCAMTYPDSVRAAGFQGEGLELGEALFDAVISSPHGLTFTVDEPEVSWTRLGTDDGRIHLAIPELLQWLGELDGTEPAATDEYPVVLSAGERRSFTANTIFRDATWRKRDSDGALRVSPDDAARFGLTDGGRARVTTAAGSAEVLVEVSATMRPGHVSLPNGYGIDGAGVAPNELTSREHRDPIAGTPFHKHVPARLESVAI